MTKEISFCWEVGGPSGFSEAEVREALLSLRDAGVPVLMSPPLLDAEGRLVAGTGGPLSPVLSDVDGAPTGRYRFVLVQSYEEAEEDELHRRVFPAKAERLAASEKAREEAERRFAVISPAGHAIDYAAWVAAMDQIERHRLDFTNCADVGRRMEVRALAAVSRAARLQYQIEREIVFLEEEAATGVSFYEATFTQRAQALRASIAAEEALAFMDAALLSEMPPLPTQVKALADSVRALLAAEPAKGAVDPEDSATWRTADGSMLVRDLVSQVMGLHPGADRLAVELAAYVAAKPRKSYATAEAPIAREHPKGEECTHYEADDGDCLTNACSGCCVTYRETLATSEAEVARLTALLHECNAVCLCGCPDSEHEADECGESCGHDNHECIRVPKAVLAYVERLRSAAPPPSDAVREAAEAIARRLFGSREHVALWDAINEFREAPNLIASEHAVVRVEDGLRAVILAALASPPAAPARDEVREAAEVIRTILTAHDARLSESGVLTYGPPSKGTGFVAAIQWLRRYDAARGGE